MQVNVQRLNSMRLGVISSSGINEYMGHVYCALNSVFIEYAPKIYSIWLTQYAMKQPTNERKRMQHMTKIVFTLNQAQQSHLHRHHIFLQHLHFLIYHSLHTYVNCIWIRYLSHGNDVDFGYTTNAQFLGDAKMEWKKAPSLYFVDRIKIECIFNTYLFRLESIFLGLTHNVWINGQFQMS